MASSTIDWLDSAAGRVTCHFPVRNDGVIGDTEVCATQQIQIGKAGAGSSILARVRTAWALALRLYSGNEAVTFMEAVRTPCNGASNTSKTLRLVLLKLSPDTRVSEISHQASQLESEDAPAVQVDNWNMVDGMKFPCNTLIASDHAITSEDKRRLHKNFPIILTLASTMDSLEISFRTGHLSVMQARNLGQVVQFALECIVQQPDVSVQSLDLLPPAQLDQIRSWNANPPKYVPECIHTQFLRFATLQPNEVAVDAWDGQLTYSQLGVLSTQLSRQIQALGVQKGDAVMVCSEKSKLVVAAWMSVFMAGAVLVPVDMQQPLPRLQQIVQASNAAAIISTPGCVSTAEEVHENVLTIDQSHMDASAGTELEAPVVQPEDTAYILFTSGSTGKPKGITVPHAAFCSAAANVASMNTVDRTLQFASYNFTPAIYEILVAICTVGTCVCIPSEHQKANDLVAFMNQTRVEWACLVPSVLRSLSPTDIKHLKTLLVLGEPMSQAEAMRWRSCMAAFYAYASSENALVTFNHRLGELSDVRNVGHSYGSCWLVDPSDHNRLVPIGTVGEVLVYSSSTASSYLDMPEMTESVFVRSAAWMPTPREGFRFCRTGDLMYLNSDGSLSFSGRSDSEGAEGGAARRRTVHSGDKSSQTSRGLFAQPGKCAGKLTGFLVPREPFPEEKQIQQGPITFISEEASLELLQGLGTAIRERIPEYMVPTLWIVVKSYPLTITDKLDRHSLLQFLQDMSTDIYERVFMAASGGPIEEPIGAVEQKLQTIWAKILQIEPSKIGRNESFLNLGETQPLP
ncbi:hypothetical protein PG997_002668 [Apiospora hydei]|uniref:AMP-dependent synthetase/ligase domain-containing protein n=1 Tax=Apiospora hydei TaxID=1337664 RepID=A0ABR1WX88_9PEZI